MIALKVAHTPDGLALLLTVEARELLGAGEGDAAPFEASPEGGLRLAKLDMSFEVVAREGARSSAYKKSLDALAS